MESQRVFGLEAALVLTDERGEFEVRDGIVWTGSGIVVDLERAADAIQARRTERTSPSNRPVY